MRDDGDFFKSTRDMAQVLLYSINISGFNLLKDFVLRYVNVMAGKKTISKGWNAWEIIFC